MTTSALKGPFVITGLDKALRTVHQTTLTVEEARAVANRMNDEGAAVCWDEARHLAGAGDGRPW